MKIYIPLRDGQVVSQEVMNGLIINNCEAVPITTKGEKIYRESNRNGNLLRAIEFVLENDEDHLMFMDSDVVLPFGIVAEILDEQVNLGQSIRTLATDKGTHGLVYIKRDRIDQLRMYLQELDYASNDDHKHCTICAFLNSTPNIMVSNNKVREVDLQHV